MSSYEQLEAAAERLRKSERGQRALENLERFFSEGGLSLDAGNKQAALKLFKAAMENPWDLPANLTQAKEGA